MNDNAYVLDLPAEFGVFTSFNVADLKPYASEDEELPSRMTSVQEGEDGEDTTSTSTPVVAQASPDAQAPSSEAHAPPVGPITRARAMELNYIMLLKNKGPRCIEDDPTGSPGGAPRVGH
jgi:hypothetical protein